MDEELGIHIPVVGLCRHERSRDFMLIRYGAKQGFGGSFVVGPLIQISKKEMISNALTIVLTALKGYRTWPAGTKLESQIGAMDSRTLSKFVKDHQFVDVLQRDPLSIRIRPGHRIGRSWKGVTGYLEEEVALSSPYDEKIFYTTLMKAFDLAT